MIIKRFDSFRISQGYIQNQFNNHVYSNELCPSSYIYVLIYVDGLLIIGINNLKALLKNKVEMKDVGATNKILGIKIRRDRRARRLCIS